MVVAPGIGDVEARPLVLVVDHEVRKGERGSGAEKFASGRIGVGVGGIPDGGGKGLGIPGKEGGGEVEFEEDPAEPAGGGEEGHAGAGEVAGVIPAAEAEGEESGVRVDGEGAARGTTTSPEGRKQDEEDGGNKEREDGEGFQHGGGPTEGRDGRREGVQGGWERHPQETQGGDDDDGIENHDRGGETTEFKNESRQKDGNQMEQGDFGHAPGFRGENAEKDEGQHGEESGGMEKGERVRGDGTEPLQGSHPVEFASMPEDHAVPDVPGGIHGEGCTRRRPACGQEHDGRMDGQEGENHP